MENTYKKTLKYPVKSASPVNELFNQISHKIDQAVVYIRMTYLLDSTSDIDSSIRDYKQKILDALSEHSPDDKTRDTVDHLSEIFFGETIYSIVPKDNKADYFRCLGGICSSILFPIELYENRHSANQNAIVSDDLEFPK